MSAPPDRQPAKSPKFLQLAGTALLFSSPLVAGGLGFWSGEAQGSFELSLTRALVYGLAFACAVPAATVALRGARWRYALVLPVLSLVWCSGLCIGGQSPVNAFNSCIHHGEQVRAQLAAHKREHGHFPAHLDELAERPACGERISRPNILHYKRVDEGYELMFGDAWVTHTATDEEMFSAAK